MRIHPSPLPLPLPSDVGVGDRVGVDDLGVGNEGRSLPLLRATFLFLLTSGKQKVQGRTDKQDVSCQLHYAHPHTLDGFNLSIFHHSRDGKCALQFERCERCGGSIDRSLGMEAGIARMWEGVVAFYPVLTVKERMKEKEKEKNDCMNVTLF